MILDILRRWLASWITRDTLLSCLLIYPHVIDTHDGWEDQVGHH